jgi:hypothetical protein
MKRLLLCVLLAVPLAAMAAGGRKPHIGWWEFMAEWQGMKQEARHGAENQPNDPRPFCQPNYPCQPSQPNKPSHPNKPGQPNKPSQPNRP